MITDEIGGGGGGAGISGSALANLLTGYATQDWVGENYISIEFFSRLFQAHGTENGQQTDIDPNDMDSTITSIESMFGFWTDYYLSALGNGGGLGSTLYLSTLADVLISSPANNQVLTYNSTLGKWVNANAQAGVTDLASLTDVTLTTPSANQALIYDGTKWINSTLKTVNGYSLIGSGDIPASGGGSGNYLPLAGGTMTGTIYYSGVQTLIQGSSNAYSDTRYGTIMGGSSMSMYNASYMAHHCKGNGSSNNYLTFGLYGADELMSIVGNGKVGIGTSTPNAKLTVISTDGYVGSFYSTDAYDTYMQFFKISGSSSTLKAEVGHSHGLSFISNQPNGARIGVNNNGTPQYWTAWNGSQYDIITSRGGTINGSLTIIGRTQGVNGDLVVANTSLSAQIAIGNYNSEYLMGFIQFNQPTVGVASASNSIRFHIYAHDNLLNIFGNGNVGIGTTSPSYKLHVDGTIYATGSVTALSDARKKNVQGDAKIGVEQIADAPAVQFLWKDEQRRKEGLQVGTLAQYWQGVLPEVVMDKGGELSMQYGVAALVSAIITARKVVDHERRISELEKENERLRTEVEQLRLN